MQISSVRRTGARYHAAPWRPRCNSVRIRRPTCTTDCLTTLGDGPNITCRCVVTWNERTRIGPVLNERSGMQLKPWMPLTAIVPALLLFPASQPSHAAADAVTYYDHV